MKIEGYLEKTVDLKYPLKMDGNDYTQLIVREAGGRDEEALSKEKDYKDIPALALAFVVCRCVSEVVGAKRLPTVEEVGELPYDVLESLGVEIRRLTLGDNYVASGKCPHCSKHVEYDITTDDLLVNKDMNHIDKVIPLRRGIVRDGKQLKNCKLRPFNAYAMRALGKLSEEEFSNPATNSELIYTLVEKFDEVEPDLEDIKDLTQVDRKSIIGAMDVQSIVKTVLPFTCGECGKDIDLRVWVFDFL